MKAWLLSAQSHPRLPPWAIKPWRGPPFPQRVCRLCRAPKAKARWATTICWLWHRRLAFPLLIKATAGGGGKGMREVRTLDEMPGLLHSARREAEASFGDGNVYLEKLVEGARHIEIQILADHFGNIIHLGERECSLQRRHQKLLEECPSPFIGDDEDLRQPHGPGGRAGSPIGWLCQRRHD